MWNDNHGLFFLSSVKPIFLIMLALKWSDSPKPESSINRANVYSSLLESKLLQPFNSFGVAIVSTKFPFNLSHRRDCPSDR